MFKAFEFRLYPNREQRHLLSRCLEDSRLLYNEMLCMAESHYEKTGHFLNRYDLSPLFNGRGGEYVPQTTVQMLTDRLDKAFRKLVQQRKLGLKAGFPRFKTANRWHSIQLRKYGQYKDVYLDTKSNRLRVPRKLGHKIKIKQHRPLEGTPKTGHLILRADGHWYIHIVCDVGEPPEKREGHAVGLDVGLTNFIADSDGNKVKNPRYFKCGAKKLRRLQRKMSRRKKDSNRRRKACKATAKQHLKITRQRKDHAHKTARVYVDRYAYIAVEDLRVENMRKNRYLANAIADVSWSAFKDILCLKAESAGCRVVKVSPRFTSQRCFNCKELVQKSLHIRTHVCPHCGYVEDRDINAAKNILCEARAEPSEHKVGGCAVLAPRS